MSDTDQLDDYAAKILAAFRETECTAKPISEDNLEFIHPDFPARTHVFANPYFLQFSTYVFARPKTFSGRFLWTRDRFLNEANQKTNLMKLTCDEPRLSGGLWSVICQCKIATGEIASAFTPVALDHLVKLWLQDLAYVVQLDDTYEVIAMLERRD